MQWPRWIASGLAGIALAMAAVACTLLVAHPASQEATLSFAGVAGMGLLTVALGAIVTWRVQQNSSGRYSPGSG